MNGKTARLLRRFVHWAGVRSQSDVRARKRTWSRMSHRERGRTRAKIEHAIAADPRALRRYEGGERSKPQGTW